MAAQKCLIGAMDHLWFHQIILFSEPSSIRAAQKPSQSIQTLSKHSSLAQGFSPPASDIAAPPQDEVSSQETDDETETETETERPTRLNLVSTKARSQSSSPSSAQKRSRNPSSRLQKTMSCKSLVDLELEEVKGFMDLGFLFEKEKLTKRIINLVPGLQRIEDEEEDEKKEIMRPYLSEAWTISRPDSPLLNFKIPRASSAADMKKTLKFWAHTVALAIQQES